MIQEQRVLHGTTDLSLLVNDYRTGEAPFAYQTGQYLYIASLFPFNNLWLELGTVNVVPATVSVSMWWGNSWVPAVDVLDETAGLTKSGRLQWNTDINKGWGRATKASDVTGITGAVIYNMYWIRLSWNATLTPGTTLKYIGQRFSNDADLAFYYPDICLPQVLEGFKEGKQSWDDQHYLAAAKIISDLRKRNIIESRSQLLDYGLFTEAACHKVCEIVYKSFGTSYQEQLKQVRSDYLEAINMKFYNVDSCGTGREDPAVRRVSTGYLSR